ncbi:hypothetical protein C3486_03505 [Streptomyces sp. Ru73]|nr:hypothetical protein C3486_03505 [Streptomyces sp. Ru73]
MPGGGAAYRSRTRARTDVPLDAACVDVLRAISDARAPVFATVRAGGRRRYGYWQPYDSRTHRGGCYVALPTDICDMLHAAGRITLGDALVDAAKTTYRVLPTDTPAEPVRRTPVAPVRLPAAPVRRMPQTLAA